VFPEVHESSNSFAVFLCPECFGRFVSKEISLGTAFLDKCIQLLFGIGPTKECKLGIKFQELRIFFNSGFFAAPF